MDSKDVPPSYNQATGATDQDGGAGAGGGGSGQAQVIQVQYQVEPSFGYRPQQMMCPYCQVSVMTETTSEPGTVSWLSCLICAALGFWCCCCIPFCIEQFQEVSCLIIH